MFDEALANSDDADAVEGQELLWILKDVIDWESGFCVDWKDAPSSSAAWMSFAPASTSSSTGAWKIPKTRSSWKKPACRADGTGARAIAPGRHHAMELGHRERRLCAGWLARGEDDEEMISLAETLGLEIRPGDQPY
ncbi:DUF6630 family protein [Cupriavidus basilensis]